jgi:hypothetical protein
VSLKPKSGPVAAQIRMADTATVKAIGLPTIRAVPLESRVNRDVDFVGLIVSAPWLQRDRAIAA